ncbi:unnamed protein product [Orchesella dallaii]|uniref:F-box domain-containing protein n=1 Tax=Orchesella dallaii TaxID=48710 RepID=A0ABP1RTJ3_9HEXA
MASTVISNVSNDKDIETDYESEHPLNNLVVLETIFSFCSREDLANCRLFSKIWETVSEPVWRERAVATMDRSIFDGYEHCRDIPFRPSTFSKYAFTEEVIRSGDIWLSLFFQGAKEWMTHLEIRNCSIAIDFMDTVSLEDLLYRNTPNLTTLILERFHMLPNNRLHSNQPNQLTQISLEHVQYEQKNMKRLEIGISELELPIRLQDMLKLYPGLEHIRIYDTTSSETRRQMLGTPMPTPSLGMDLLSLLGRMRKENSNKLCLKTLDIIGGIRADAEANELFDQINSNLCKIFQNMNLPLECLTIELPNDIEFHEIRKVISQHSKTLTKLDIYRQSNFQTFPHFPSNLPLNNLTVLRMQDNLCKDFTFLKSCPNLKTLHVCEVEEQSWIRRARRTKTAIINETILSDMEGVRIESLKEFRFDYKCDSYEIGLLSDWMPNVERLIMTFTNETLRTACQKWAKLKDLAVFLNPMGEAHGNVGANMGFLQSSLKNLKNFHVIGNPSQLGFLDSTGLHSYTKNLYRFF